MSTYSPRLSDAQRRLVLGAGVVTIDDEYAVDDHWQLAGVASEYRITDRTKFGSRWTYTVVPV